MEEKFPKYGERIAYAMKLRGWDKARLAKVVPCSTKAVDHWLRADRPPNGGTPRRIAEVLNLNLPWLMENSGPASSDIPESLVMEAQEGYRVLEDTFPGVDPMVMGQAALALTRALDRLQISMGEERFGKALFSIIHKAQVTGEKPTEDWAIEVILNP